MDQLGIKNNVGSRGSLEPLPAVVHVDVDGLVDIYRAHGWNPSLSNDPIFETGLINFLEIFSDNHIQATFFVIASSLDSPRKRELLSEVVRQGHEIASHSLTHAFLTEIDSGNKVREIANSREKIEKILDVEVKGFRAPGYRIDRESIELLARYRYSYDSSVFPDPETARYLDVPYEVLSNPGWQLPGLPIVELSLPAYRPLPFPINPSYALIFGSLYFKLGFNRYRQQRKPFVLLFHLIDMAEPLGITYSRGLKSRLFTLSILSQSTKKAGCQLMIDMVKRNYRVTTTNDLLKNVVVSGDQIKQE